MISDHAEPAKINNRSNDMEILDLTMNNRVESSLIPIKAPLNPAPSSQNIRDDLVTRDDSDNNSINNKSVNSNFLSNYKKTNEIVRILPEFNGRNISINRFIRECKEAENFVNPNDRSFFLKLVKSRVTGDVNDYLQFKNFDSLDQLLSELKRVFAPTQNLPQIQTDLARVRQSPQEKVFEYGLRVTRILQKAQELIVENFNSIVAGGMIEGTTNTAIECFTLGLESEIAARMIGKQFFTLESAISTAISCERYVQQRKELHGDKLEDSRKRAYCHIADPQREEEPERKKRHCYRCGESGHIARD